jgi:hypothetical protein
MANMIHHFLILLGHRGVEQSNFARRICSTASLSAVEWPDIVLNLILFEELSD